MNGVIENDDPVQRALVRRGGHENRIGNRAVFGENYADPVRVGAVGRRGTLDDVRRTLQTTSGRGVDRALRGHPFPCYVEDAQRFVITREEAEAMNECPEGRSCDQWEIVRRLELVMSYWLLVKHLRNRRHRPKTSRRS